MTLAREKTFICRLRGKITFGRSVTSYFELRNRDHQLKLFGSPHS